MSQLQDSSNGLPTSLDEETKQSDVETKTEICNETTSYTLVVSNSKGETTRIKILKEAAMQCELFKTMIDGDANTTELPVPNIKEEATIQKVITFLNYNIGKKFAYIERPLKSSDMEQVVDKWRSDFINVPEEMLFDLILAANYLDNKDLLDLACAKVASMIKGKTPEEIRKIFNIENDFTPEQEIALIAENNWDNKETI